MTPAPGKTPALANAASAAAAVQSLAFAPGRPRTPPARDEADGKIRREVVLTLEKD